MVAGISSSASPNTSAGSRTRRRRSNTCCRVRSAATPRCLRFYAAKMGVNYESFEAVARTNFDVRGHMMPDAPPSGFQKVTIAINVKSDAPPEKLREIEQLALKGCPGIATLRDPVAVETALTVTPAAHQAAVA